MTNVRTRDEEGVWAKEEQVFLPQNGEDEDEALERKWLKIPPLKKGPLNEPHRPPFIGK